MAWPDYAHVVAPELVSSQDNDVERTPFDDGLIRQEKRYNSALLTWQVEALLDSDEDKTRFEGWARENAHIWFAWTDPATGERRNVSVRGGAGGVEYRSRVYAAQQQWTASMTLEGWAHGIIPRQ